MSDLNLTLRLKALGDIAKPFKNLLNTTNKLQQNFDKTRAAASAMQRQLQSITHLRKLRASLAQNSAELAKMRDKTRAWLCGVLGLLCMGAMLLARYRILG